MENLSLFSLNNTNLYHLENGVQHPLLSRCQLDIILVELKDQTDVETLGLNYLCFLTWVLEDKSIISIPLLSGATVTKKDEGYLVMLGSSKVYYVEFPGAPSEVYESFKAVLSEFTRANSVTVGKTLPEQLDYIYGKGEGAVSTENLPASEEHSGLTKVVVKCSECLHYAIVSTASIAGKGIKKGAQLYIKHSSPQGEYHVNENVKKGLDVFASTAGKVAEVAQNVVGTTADILSQGVNMIISPFQNHESQGHIKIPKELKATGNFFITTLDSFGHVYGGVIEGTEIIIGDLTSSTVDVASHRYGIRVGEATQSGMTAINSYTKAAKHVANFTHPVRFARAITKTTGKRIVATKPSGKKGTEKVEKVDSELSLRSLMGNNTLGALPKRSEGHVVVSREEMQKRGMSEESVDLSSRCPPELSHGPNAKA